MELAVEFGLEEMDVVIKERKEEAETEEMQTMEKSAIIK